MRAQQYLETHWIKNRIWTHLDMPKHQERLRRCADYLRGYGNRFIDVGCALGHSTDIMHRFLPGDWAGFEFFKGASVKAQELFPDINFYTTADFNLLPVCGQFDGVVCSEVIEHVENDKALIAGLLAITGKILVLTTPNARVKDPGHLRVYNAKQLRALFSPDENVEIESIGKFFYIIVRR